MIDITSLLSDEHDANHIKIEVKGRDLLEFGKSLINQSYQEFKNHFPVPFYEEYLTRKEVTIILKISLSTLWYWKKRGILTPIRIGNKIRYRRSDIEKCLISSQKED
ncbi:DNA-binding protein [Ancylomarina euxinus]|uniref:DNA-binding protein n=1 Tax=Ancylomarina euxinus TaxID=2283627 RepID=A0A425Y958_9BACT|nr:helix-turn-helix domain-containing protein [Ancylomarina euxinus]MCZ4693384.1 helix-turn-helix domain-containing protein [Ancylomarina euxinus]MUP13612.1 helix-turn-helix domain-containing protein [Ancylomarina euxinus]RRG24872.1 DNA-binding protein [Ancylomarina euxinus]